MKMETICHARGSGKQVLDTAGVKFLWAACAGATLIGRLSSPSYFSLSLYRRSRHILSLAISPEFLRSCCFLIKIFQNTNL
jgi:hypothetical protein